MCGSRLAENSRRKKVAKNRHVGTIAQICRAISSQLRNISTIGKNLFSSNMSSTCPRNMVNFSTNGWDLLASLGHPCKFQRVSRLAFVTAATSLTGGQPNFARCMAVFWPGTLYIHSCLLTEFCHMQNSLSVHLRTIAQVSRTISSQLRHLSTIGKKVY